MPSRLSPATLVRSLADLCSGPRKMRLWLSSWNVPLAISQKWKCWTANRAKQWSLAVRLSAHPSVETLLESTANTSFPIDWDQVAEWDPDNSVPMITVAPGATVHDLPARDIHVVFEPAVPGGLPLRMLFEPFNSDTLVISLHGAMDRTKFSVPRFEWRRTMNRLEAARLYLSDSTLEINGSLEIGWYIGTEKQDLIADYAKVVNEVISAGGYSRVVCVGSSAGGFGALALSRRIRNSVAVVFSPQTTIGGYHLRQRKALAAAAFPRHKSYERVEVEFGTRVNLRKLYQELSPVNFVHFVQNTGDRFHFEAHYVPFALANGVNPEKGGHSVRRGMNFVTECYEAEHAPPSRRGFLDHIQQAHLNYYGRELLLRPPDPAREAELGPR